MNETFDIVIPYHNKDRSLIELCVKNARKNIPGIGSIYIITKASDLRLDCCIILDEDKFFNNGLNKSYIESKLAVSSPDLKYRAGWFLQQFIKMGCAQEIESLSENYLVIDSDVVFLKQITFFRNGKTFLTRGNENHQPYLNLYERLFDKTSDRSISFVAHHMMINKFIMIEIIKTIENKLGKRWYDAILESLYKSEYMLSEYEIYGHYLMNKYPDKLKIRRLCNIQRFKLTSVIKLYLGFADYATIHSYKKPKNNRKTNAVFYKIIRNKLGDQYARAGS
jgi:hypothetical protein